MTMTRPPATAPAPRPPASGRTGPSPRSGPGGPSIAGIPVRLTPGAYLLGALAAGLTALTLPAAAPGRPAIGYLAATAGVVVVLLASLVAHELAHAVVARRYGRPATVRRLRRAGYDSFPNHRGTEAQRKPINSSSERPVA